MQLLLLNVIHQDMNYITCRLWLNSASRSILYAMKEVLLSQQLYRLITTQSASLVLCMVKTSGRYSNFTLSDVLSTKKIFMAILIYFAPTGASSAYKLEHTALIHALIKASYISQKKVKGHRVLSISDGKQVLYLSA